jgi:hypothetical protein
MSLAPLPGLALFALTLTGLGCMPPQQAPPPAASSIATASVPAATTSTSAATPPRATAERPIYRFDFVLAASDAATPASTTSFTLTLQEFEKGEMIVGKNVPLSTPAPTATGTQAASPRQDVGMKVVATFRTSGDDVLLDVNTEMSAFEPPSSIRKVVSRGNALASPGKPALVTTLESDSKRYQLTVTPTKVR